MKLFLAVVLLAMCSAVYFRTGVVAAQSGGVSISPAFKEIVIQPDDTSAVFEVEVTNNNTQTQTFEASIVDFGSLDETGGIAFLGLNSDDIDYTYGLASWATLDQNVLVVEPGKTASVKVTVINRESLSPGGHYGAVLLTLVANNEQATQKQRVSVSQIASSLLFVKKVGGEVYRLELSDVQVSKDIFTLPKQLTLRFANSGNVHVVPRGTLSVIGPFGRQVATGVINTNSAIIMPESHRQYVVDMQQSSKLLLPGMYTVHINYRFDGEDKFVSETTQFFHIGSLGTAILVTLVLGCLGSGYWLYRKRKKWSLHK